MTPSQKLRSIADSTGLDGIADAIREIANEIEHNNAPAVPIQVNDAMAIAFHNALSDGPIDLDEMDDIKTGLNAALANVQAPAPTVPRGEAWGYVDHRGCAIKFKNARHRSELANAIECGGLEYLYTSPAEKLGNDIQSALESLVERCNHDAGMSNEDAVIHAEAVLERVYNSRSTTPAPAPARSCPEACKSPEKCCNFGCQRDAQAPAPAPAQEPARPQNCGTSYCSCIECVVAPAQEVGLTGPVVAWRMRDTGFRRPKYVYFDTKEQAVAHAAQLLQSRDDGHLTELTPLCEASTGTDLLDALRDNSWKLEPFEMPTGQGDADIGWRVVGFYMGKPKERIEATVYTDDPAAAIIAALRAKGAV